MAPNPPSLRPLPATLTVRSRTLRQLAIGLASTTLVACLLLHLTVARADWLAVDDVGRLLDLSGHSGVPRWLFVCLTLTGGLMAWWLYAVSRVRREGARRWLVAAVLLSTITVALGARFPGRLVEAGFARGAGWLEPWTALPALSVLVGMIVALAVWAWLLARVTRGPAEYRLAVSGHEAAGPDPHPAVGVVRFRVHPARVTTLVVASALFIEVALVLLDYGITLRGDGVAAPLRAMFNVAREDSLPNWFGATQTFMMALTLWAIFLVVRARTESRRLRGGWLVIAVFFTYMAFDDGTRFHETVGALIDWLAETSGADEPGWASIRRLPSYTWQLVFVPVFAAAGLFTAYFLLRHGSRAWMRLAVPAALGLLGLALVLDFLEGLEAHHPWNPSAAVAEWLYPEISEPWFRRRPRLAVLHVAKVLEEWIEMLANTMLWAVFLGQLFELGACVRVRVRGAVAPPRSRRPGASSSRSA